MRKFTAAILVPVMKLTGFRFSKDYRHAQSGIKYLIYKFVNTIQANLWAGV